MKKDQPKRRKAKENPYRISKKGECFFVSFRDVSGKLWTVEVDRLVYDSFEHFEREDLSFLNIWDRHLEQSELTDASLNQRATKKEKSIEETMIQNIQKEQLHKTISQLPEKQRRRIKMYYFDDMTYQEIAEKEGCTLQAVAKSIGVAEKS